MPTRWFPPTFNDEQVTAALVDPFRERFQDNFDEDTPRTNVSEDFSVLGTSQGRPYSFFVWMHRSGFMGWGSQQ